MGVTAAGRFPAAPATGTNDPQLSPVGQPALVVQEVVVVTEQLPTAAAPAWFTSRKPCIPPSGRLAVPRLSARSNTG